MKKLKEEFYLREDVVQIAKDLLGKVIYSHIDGKTCGGIITETEAYAGITDKASHAYGGKRSKRTEAMYADGGISYIYLCYGIHSLFNVVTNHKNIPHAVLIRAIKPIEGLTEMLLRRKKPKLKNDTCIGPGKVSQALGLTVSLNSLSLQSDIVWIEDHNISFNENQIKTGTRIGIDYAGEDASLPYRFWAW
ncbi:MAG: DNA-3-methyladenine glycosylase [Bacteroidetes bacterium]|nr:DNA-3-methyladenine glycosylase [Bacteroidota bacterium]MBT7826908.1 DNA-3-methyladenine glycosylase [Bacteroidota bacterium]